LIDRSIEENIILFQGHKNINFYLEKKNVRYDMPCFIVKNFLAPSLRAYKAGKRCACERLILCPCHDVCEMCGAKDCEMAQKAIKVTVDIMADRVLSCIVAFNSRYNDPGEDQTMKDHGQ
jgi:hypothetical protein